MSLGITATIDANGLTRPDFAAILTIVQNLYRGIYGNDIYIEPDSQDGQLLALLSQGFQDLNDTAQAVYLAFSPGTAVGAGLDSVIKVNGLQRLIATNSTVVLTLVGQQGALVPAGSLIGDNLSLGTVWSTNEDVTFDLLGQTVVTATCTVLGAVKAAPDTITNIQTPVPGWQTSTNVASAAPGAPVEIDAVLRRRQSKSTSLPAITPREAIYAAVANLTSVLRAEVFDNDTDLTVRTIPPHHIAVVVSGGDVFQIAQTIAAKKAPGVPTYGNTSQIVFDNLGVPSKINYFPLTSVTANILIFLKALVGYVDTTATLIQQAAAFYINGLGIGESSYLGRLWAPADLKGDEATGGTNVTQPELDKLTTTYHITAIAQNRSDTIVSGGPYVAGATSITVTNVEEVIAVNDVVYFILDDLSYFRSIVTNIVGSVLTIAPGVPGGRSIPDAGLVYVVDDLNAEIFEAFAASTTNIIVIAS